MRTYADIVGAYTRHPEAKFADADGRPCGPQTKGQLHRRHIGPESLRYIGKEAELIDEVTVGLHIAADDPGSDYTPSPDRFHRHVIPVLASIPTSAVVDLANNIQPDHGFTAAALTRTIQRSKNGVTPRGAAKRLLEDCAVTQAMTDLKAAGEQNSWGELPLPALRSQLSLSHRSLGSTAGTLNRLMRPQPGRQASPVRAHPATMESAARPALGTHVNAATEGALDTQMRHMTPVFHHAPAVQPQRPGLSLRVSRGVEERTQRG